MRCADYLQVLIKNAGRNSQSMMLSRRTTVRSNGAGKYCKLQVTAPAVKLIMPNKTATAENSTRPGLLSAKIKFVRAQKNWFFNCFLRESTTSRLTRRFVLLNIKNVYLPKPLQEYYSPLSRGRLIKIYFLAWCPGLPWTLTSYNECIRVLDNPWRQNYFK